MALAVATDLKSMIELIPSRTLLCDLIESHIHNSGITLKKLDKDKHIRASYVYEKLLEIKSSRSEEENSLVGALSVIAVLNQDESNQSYMLREIENVPRLAEQLTFYPFQCDNEHSLANIAAWINMKSATDGVARDVWEELVGVAQTQQQKNTLWRIFCITPPQKHPHEFPAGIVEFQKDFKRFEEGKGTTDDFDSEVFPSSLDRCTRYIINTTKPLREVKMREKDESGKATWRIGKDNHQTGFIIDHYFMRDYIAISRVVSGDEEEIAEMFLHDVLGSEIVKQEKKFYDLNKFSSSKCREFLRLPQKMEKDGEHIWVSGIEIAVSDKKSTVFPNVKLKRCQFDEATDIHTFLNKLITGDLYIIDILKVTITLQLRKRQYQMGKWLIEKRSEGFNEYIFTLSPTNCSFNPKLKSIKSDHDYNFIMEHRAEWHLDGEGKKEHAQRKAEEESRA